MRSLVVLLWVAACGGGPEAVMIQPSPLTDVPESDRWVLPGLSAPATVIYTAGGVPRIYARDRVDLARVYGFTLARDRYFQMDLVRLLAQGRLSEVLGDVGLDLDVETRMISMTAATDSLLASLSPEQERRFAAYARGFDDYIYAVRAGRLPPPSEYELAAGLLGYEDPADLLMSWSVRDVASIGGAILFRLRYETGDVGRSEDLLRLDGLFDGVAGGELRQAGAWQVAGDVAPLFDVASALDGWGQTGSRPRGP